MYGYLASSLYYIIYLTWLDTVSIGICGSYFIDLVLCYMSISWLGDILPYVTIKYWMDMKRVPVNCPVVLFLVDGFYFLFYCQDEFLGERSFHSSCFVEDS